MAETTKVQIITVRGDNYIRQDDVVRLVLNAALAGNCQDDRHMLKQLAENIANGKVHSDGQTKG